MTQTDQERTRLKSSPYGCIRYTAHPWTKWLIDKAKGVEATRDPAAVMEVETLLDREILPRLLQGIQQHIASEESILHIRTLYDTRAESLCYWAYVANGRETFDFGATLVEELRQTDIQHARLEQLRLPYPALFLQFGAQSGIGINDAQRTAPETFDGTFVWQEPDGTLHLALTFSRAGQPCSGLSGPTLRITPDLLGKPADEALRLGLANSAQESLQIQRQMASEQLQGEIQAQQDTFMAAVTSAANLVVNALFYLSSYRPASQQQPSPETPAELARKLQSAKTAKARRDAGNAILKSGHTLVKLCGTEHSNSSFVGDSSQCNNSMRTHWRRGHWRNQPCGPGLSETRLVWVRPSLIAAGRETIESRTYEMH